MATVSLHQATAFSCSNKPFVGLRAQSPDSFGPATPNTNVEFHKRVYKSLTRPRNSKTTRGCATMMPIGTPRVPYKNPSERSWQWIDMWNALYRERIIFIGQHIDEEFSNQILATMLYLDSIGDSRKLYMYINGPGGDLNPSLALYDTMQSLNTPIGTHCIGFAYNMATFLLVGGLKGHRSAMPLARIGFEPPAGAARGQADDIRNEADQLLRVRDYLFEELASKTGQPIDKIHKDFTILRRYSSEEAIEYGLIDRIVRPSRVKGEKRMEDPNVGLG